MRDYTFKGTAGQHIDLYVDGLFQREGGAEPGLDTRARLYLGSKKIATSDDTTEPGWILRSNEAPNAHSSNLSLDLPADGEYRLSVTSKGNRQGSAEVVVKTPDVDFCATASDYDEATNTTFLGAHNFDTELEAQQWLAQTWPTADTTEVIAGPCYEPAMCAEVYEPVCAQTAAGIDQQFGNPCEFRNAVLAEAGDETPMESKGKYVPGVCNEVDLCATVLVQWPENTDTYVYVKNFNDGRRGPVLDLVDAAQRRQLVGRDGRLQRAQSLPHVLEPGLRPGAVRHSSDLLERVCVQGRGLRACWRRVPVGE